MNGFENHFLDERGVNYFSLPTNPKISEDVAYDELNIPSISDYFVAISTHATSYCVGIVDMMNSTKISAELGPKKTSRYYQLFLNSMSVIVSKFGGAVIKNVGDCLVYYFPESAKFDRQFGFMSCLECSLAMIESHDVLCQRLEDEELPRVDYRISADYGSVIMMRANDHSSPDMVGPPLNMCSKINRLAKKNGSVIGGDLYQMVKKISDYKFHEIKGYNLGFKYPYSVYEVQTNVRKLENC